MLTSLLLIIAISGLVWVAVVVALRVGLDRHRAPVNPAEPTVAVLVAARNEAANIEALVRCLIAQDYPKEKLQLIVLDDSSTDDTAQLAVKAASNASNFRLISVPPPPAGISPKKHALTVGIATVESEVILTTDADCRPGPLWVRSIAAYFEDGVNAAVGHSPIRCQAPIPPLIPRGWQQNSQADPRGDDPICIPAFDAFVNAVVAAGTIGLGVPTTAVGRNFAYRRSAFEAVGGFGASLSGASGDDDLLLQRIASQISNFKFQISNSPVRFATSASSVVPASGASSLRDWLRVKRRHLSAGMRYSPALILFGGILYLFNVGLLATAALALSCSISYWWVAGLWGVKAVADGLTLSRGAKLLGERRWFFAWLIAELISPVIFTVMVPLSMVGKVKWKGRELGR